MATIKSFTDIEQKAKAYDEAIERAKIWQNHLNESGDKDYADELEYIFPELAESKDERIRKAIIEFFELQDDNTTYSFISKKDILAWLEKQKPLTDEEFKQGKEDVLWYIEQAKKVAKDENEMGTCWFAEKWLEKQSESYTKKDVDDAFVEGMAFAKKELEKQGEQKLANSAKTCKKSQRMVSAEAKEALYDKPATIDIDKMVDDYANNKERGNEEFGKPVPCMIRAYRQGLKDAIGKGVSNPNWSEDDDKMLTDAIGAIGAADYYTYDDKQEIEDWLKSLKQRIGG